MCASLIFEILYNPFENKLTFATTCRLDFILFLFNILLAFQKIQHELSAYFNQWIQNLMYLFIGCVAIIFVNPLIRLILSKLLLAIKECRRIKKLKIKYNLRLKFNNMKWMNFHSISQHSIKALCEVQQGQILKKFAYFILHLLVILCIAWRKVTDFYVSIIAFFYYFPIDHVISIYFQFIYLMTNIRLKFVYFFESLTYQYFIFFNCTYLFLIFQSFPKSRMIELAMIENNCLNLYSKAYEKVMNNFIVNDWLKRMKMISKFVVWNLML